jgi:hypothetical protein
LTFRQAEVSDVLKSLTVLDLDGGHVASVSYDSTKPLEQLLADVALSIPDDNSLVGLLPQIKGARVAVVVHESPGGRVEGTLLGIDTTQRQTADGVVNVVLVSVLTDAGAVRSFDLHALSQLEMLDPSLRRDLDYYLRTQLSAKKKDARSFTFFARGEGQRRVRISYTLEAPVWKATYRILLGEESVPPLIQGWAVVDNTQDEDWEGVNLSLVAELPVSFVHDLYTPRYIRRPVDQVQETTGVLPPQLEDGMNLTESLLSDFDAEGTVCAGMAAASPMVQKSAMRMAPARRAEVMASSAPAQVRERKLGDLFEYEIAHPVTIRRNQSALVPIVQRSFEGRPVLLYNPRNRADNPMRAVEMKNTTGLTLEGGPVTVLDAGSYVGEAMLDTLKPDVQRLVPYAVELGVHVLSNVDSHQEKVHKVVIREGRLHHHAHHVMKTTYLLHNRSDTDQVCWLEHPRDGAEWTLFETTAPDETTENFWRFRFPLPRGVVTRFVVRQRLSVQHTQILASIDPQELTLWLEQKHVDARTESALREVIAAQRQVAAIVFHAGADLGRQFARGGENQGAHRAASARGLFRAQALQQRQGKAGGLAGTGLGAGENVAAFENDRNGLALNRGRIAVALFGHGTEQFGRQAERIK